jgi:hypothetical protein
MRTRLQRTEMFGVQLPSCGRLPVTNTFSPYTVVTVGANVTATAEGAGAQVGVGAGTVDDGPRIISPRCSAIDVRSGIVTENVPRHETVYLLPA